MVIAVEQIHFIVIAFVYFEYKQFSSSNEINGAANTLFKIRKDSLEIIYSLFRTKRRKTIPCPAAHPRIGHKGVHPLASCYREVLLRRGIPQDFQLENSTLNSCLNQHTDSTGCTTCDKICSTVFYLPFSI